MTTIGTVMTAKTLYGDIKYFGFDAPIGDALRLYGQWAKTEIDFMQQFIAEGDTVVDGGANVGTHAMGFAAACGPNGRVFAVEASPEIAALLKQTVQINDLRQVEVLNVALGSDNGICAIARLDPGKPQNTGLLQTVRLEDQVLPGLQVEQITLDSLSLDTLSLLKLDIEGGELSALKGAQNTIKVHRPVISVEALNLSSSLAVMHFLEVFDYKVFFCSFPAYSPNNFNNISENMFGVAREAILLFVPDSATIPISVQDSYIASVSNADDMARLLSEMPRYGDRTDHDRILESIISERNRYQEMSKPMTELYKIENTITSAVERLTKAEDFIERYGHAQNTFAGKVDILVTQFEATKADLIELHTRNDKILADLCQLEKDLPALVNEASSQSDEQMARLKSELTSLREVFFEREEVLSKTVLELQGQLSDAQSKGFWKKLSSAMGL